MLMEKVSREFYLSLTNSDLQQEDENFIYIVLNFIDDQFISGLPTWWGVEFPLHLFPWHIPLSRFVRPHQPKPSTPWSVSLWHITMTMGVSLSLSTVPSKRIGPHWRFWFWWAYYVVSLFHTQWKANINTQHVPLMQNAEEKVLGKDLEEVWDD